MRVDPTILRELMKELDGKLHEDGTYHVTEDMMTTMILEIATLRTVKKDCTRYI